MLSKVKKPYGSLILLLSLLVIFFAENLLFRVSVSAQATEHKAQAPQKVPAPRSLTAIPVAEVATRSTEVSNLLRNMSTQLAASHEIETIRRRLQEDSGQIELELSATMKILKGQPTLLMLQNEQQLWQKRQQEMTRWLNLVTQHTNRLQEALNQLLDLQKTWSQTRDAAKVSKAAGPIMQQIEGTLAAIEAAQTPLQVQLISVLDLQSRVAQDVNRCETALAQVSWAQQKAVGGLLKRDSLPIWSARLWIRAQEEGATRIRDSTAVQWEDIRQYVQEPSKGMPLHVGLFVLLAVIFCAMRRQLHRWSAAGEGSSLATSVFDRPYAVALVVTLLVASSPHSPIPLTVRELFNVVELAPMIRLTLPAVDPRLISGLYALLFLFALDTARQIFAGVSLIEQAVIMLEILAGMAVLGWALTFGHLRQSQTKAAESARLMRLRTGAIFILVVLGVGLLAGALGYLRLARLLTSGVFIGGALALALYTYLRVTGSVVAFALRVWPLRLLLMIQRHRDLVERRIYHVLVLLAVTGGMIRFLDYVGLFQPALSLGKAFLAARLERGAISISLGDVLAFVLTVWVSYLLSRFIRFLLQEDVYPRIGIARGLSYAISSLLHYVILALGFVVGMGLLGVNLTKVTVLAGAFGVGIGFGLQSIVNNFVSGLILLFERPIHVGDIVEIGDLQGEVKRIGIRSSIVRTWVGSDIIVPNSQLVSEQVTNWTLSDELRRIDVPVGVNYGAEPQKVIEVMEAVARAHPHVLQHPAPHGLFVGYGDSSINFELRAWTDQYTKWYQVQSDLTVALYHAVKKEAGMTFPFPQREVRLLHDPKVESTVVATSGVSEPSRPEGSAEAAPEKKGPAKP
jgi:potassium efflux system protein